MAPEPSLKTVEEASLMVAPWCGAGVFGGARGVRAFVEDCRGSFVNGGTVVRAGLFGGPRGARGFVEDCRANFGNGGTVAPEPASKTVKLPSPMVAPW